MRRRPRPPSYAENRLAELQSLDRPLTRDERLELTERKKQVRWQAMRRERYASDPEYRRREIERNTRYWYEARA